MSSADTSCDVAVIGLGPGGEEVAGRLAEAGLDVIGVDHRLVGGECPYWGCVPSKMMIRAAVSLTEARRVPELAGSTGDVVPDWSIVAKRIRDEATDSWNDAAAVKRFEQKGGRFIRGTGVVTGADTIAIDGVAHEVRRAIVVNTGTVPAIPPIDGLDDVSFWTNHEIIEATELPASLIVLGGGAIGCELSQVAARFGTRVTLVEAAPRLLVNEDPEAGEQLRAVFESEGIDVHTGTGAVNVGQAGGEVHVRLEDGTVLTAERLLVAAGRKSDLAAVGLGSVGVPADARTVEVDDRCKIADGVYAVGDITGKGAFTHVSMYQAAIVVADILGQDHPAADYRATPHVTFTEPEVGSVGMTEEQARKAFTNVLTGEVQMPSVSRGYMHKLGNEGFIKLVADGDRGVLVGGTAMGPAGGEILGAITLAVHAEVPITSLSSAIYAYPTFHRGIADALADLS